MSINLRTLITVIILFVSLGFSAQSAEGDSLQLILDSKQHDSEKVILLNKKAWALVNSGILNPAIEYLNAAEKLALKINMKHKLAQTLAYKGIAYRMLGEYKDAIENLSKAMKMAEELNNYRGQATCLGNLGIIYESQHNYKKALEFYQKALDIRTKMDDKEGMTYSYNDIAILFDLQKDFTNARIYFNKALNMSRETGDSVTFYMCYGSLASSYLLTKDLDKARDHILKALHFSIRNEDKENEARNYCVLGEIEKTAGNYSAALDAFTKALNLAKEINTKEIEKDVNLLIAHTYTATGAFENAYRHQERFIFIKDSILNTETAKQMAEMNSKYEAEKKDKLLLKQKTENERQQYIKNGFILGFSVLLVLIVFVFRSYVQKKKDNKTIQLQKNLVEEKQKEIIDSIQYAKRIQNTLLAHDSFLKEHLPGYFVYFKPKDIVSGDFYWATKKNNRFYLAVCDSTGHGVPGAFMSLLSIGFMNEAINEKNIEQPGEIFDHVRQKLIDNISREEQKDGFDGILLCIEKQNTTYKISYAAANNNPVIISEKGIQILPYDRMPVGIGEKKDHFNNFDISLQGSDYLFLYTDGFADQFGGPKGKKLKYKTLNESLVKNINKPLQDQKQELNKLFEDWKGSNEQVDDVCVVGIRF